MGQLRSGLTGYFQHEHRGFFARGIPGLQEQLLSLGALPQLWGMDSLLSDGVRMRLTMSFDKSGNHRRFWLPT